MNLLIPLAAFAVSVASANAFSPELLRQAGLNDQQIAAFHEARELKQAGDHEGARDVLIEANIDEEVMEELREVLKQERHDHNIALRAAIEAKDYDSFRAAVTGSPLEDIIDTEAEFNRFVEAHAMMRSGEKDDAKEIFDELGLNWGQGKSLKFNSKGNGDRSRFMSELNDGEREELRAAMEVGNHEKVKEILQAAGVEWKPGERKNQDR